MSKSYYRSKPAAMVVTVIALSFVLPDSAVAETDTVAKAIGPARVRRIVNQQINKRAPELSVGSAVSAQSANTANNANPVLFARVAADGTVDPANSQGVTSANVTKPSPRLFCFSGLPAIKGGQVTPEIAANAFFESGLLGFGDAVGNCRRDAVLRHDPQSDRGRRVVIRLRAFLPPPVLVAGRRHSTWVCAWGPARASHSCATAFGPSSDEGVPWAV